MVTAPMASMHKVFLQHVVPEIPSQHPLLHCLWLQPPFNYSYGASETRVAVVDKTMEEQEELLGNVRYRLEPA